VFFGISSGFMIYLFHINTSTKDENMDESEAQQSPRHLTMLESEESSEDNNASVSLSCGESRSQCCRTICRLIFSWHFTTNFCLLAMYGGVAGVVLCAFQHSSKPRPDVSNMKELNQALESSIRGGGGVLHIANYQLLGPGNFGSLGSCSKKGQQGGPPGNLPCRDVPDYHVGAVDLPMGIRLSAFTTEPGGPIYEAEACLQTSAVEGVPSAYNMPGIHFKVGYVSGLEKVNLDYVRFIDKGISKEKAGNKLRDAGHRSPKGGSTRKIQLQIAFVIWDFKTALHPSLPVSVQLGPIKMRPCCNPERLIMTLDMKCNRQYPFFKLAAEENFLNIAFDPPDAMKLQNLEMPTGFVKNVESLQGKLEEQILRLTEQSVKSTKNTSSLPGLEVYYPYPEFSVTDLLSFFISSNLPIHSSNQWDFCPDTEE